MRGPGVDVRKVKWYEVLEALRHYKIWLFCAMGSAIYETNSGVTAFGSLIVKVR
ncbi:hypothetical protein BC835DRAFT_1458373 [Cytidiella melzeri]|nr:hypothetical protein BC835DRAFT_1298654 [Cytidiella melzeri]KAI0686264.1 hypothetical protein BC835DRAFT_1288514 [Cytidiella melzeri]KAI0699589.1 hypothetical protein BC835DRAFT_1458373 [Cytidiella melzeri]